MNSHSAQIEEYLRHMAAAGARPATLRLRRWQLRRVFFTCDGSTAEVETVLANPWWQPATRASMVAAVRGYWRWCGRLADAEGLRPPKLHQPRRDACDEAALADGLALASGDDYWLLRLLCDTGLRRGEAAAVSSGDVGEDGWLTVEGKGGKVRRVPVPGDLAAWIAGRAGWCFPSAHTESGHICDDHVYRVVRRWTGAHPHQLRHRYATRAYRASHDLRAVQRLLGHSSVATTQRYVAVDDAELLACAAAAWAA